tara:strand:- start:27 stop:614 length:588 start_codon:yes stop_codon:yes gene_type:complete
MKSAVIKVGSVYIAGKDGRVKIGASTDPEKRVKVILRQGGMPDDSFSYISNKSKKYMEHEAATHNKFLSRNIGGEWFNIYIDEAVLFVSGLVGKMSKEEIESISKDNEKTEVEKSKLLNSLTKTLLKSNQGISDHFETIKADTYNMAVALENESLSEAVFRCDSDLLKLMLLRSSIQHEMIKALLEISNINWSIK